VKSASRQLWESRTWRYARRGTRSLFEAISQSELKAAADLYHEYVTDGIDLACDFGAGNGHFWRMAIPYPRCVVLFDLAFPEASFSPSLLRVRGDATQPPLRKSSASFILALGLLEYLDDIELVFRYWRELALPSALMLASFSPFTLPNLGRRLIDGQVRLRSEEEVSRALLCADWRIVLESVRQAGWQTLFVAKVMSSAEVKVPTVT
jgi:hypothetical protein